MRDRLAVQYERRRVTTGDFATDASCGMNGLFHIRHPATGRVFRVIASDGRDWKRLGLGGEVWEHVSVSLDDRCPTWEEMDWIKRIFWRDDETVLQFHVPRSDHVNYHAYCLHLWRPTQTAIPMPPKLCV